jgi:uncharacterized protein (TIGR00730 family)
VGGGLYLYNESVAEARRYQLRSEAANRLIEELVEALAIPPETRSYFVQMVTTALKLHEDGAGPADLKITNTALKEMRYAFRVFAPYSAASKVTVFGSARTRADEPARTAALAFGQRMVREGWMVVTGAGAGIMGAAQEGAGGERSFGLNIRLPFEQEANPWIASDPKLITFKYFFTRKLFLVKEANALALFPGGFGTGDEAFEALTLMQTGKSALVPVVLLEVGSTPYWRPWERFVREVLVAQRLIDPDDARLFRIAGSVEEAVAEILRFYRVFHSSRIVGDNIVFRLRGPLPETAMREMRASFDDILKGPPDQIAGPLPQEDGVYPDLWRLILPFTRTAYGRLRQLIDFINTQ